MVATNASRRHLQRNNTQLISISHIWISDTVLQRAWHSFASRNGARNKPTAKPCSSSIARSSLSGSTSSLMASNTKLASRLRHSQSQRSFNILPPQLRHGSSVPGPLEARRRRSSRKRMTGLAFMDLNIDDIDPGVFMGMDPKKKRKLEEEDWVRKHRSFDLTSLASGSTVSPAEKTADSSLTGCEYKMFTR